MGAIVRLDNRWIKISNGSWKKLVDDAITIAKSYVTTTVEQEYVDRLYANGIGFFPGYCPDFESLFPTLDEKKFWVRCFYDAGRWLHEGRLENPPGGGASPAMWIFYTYWCGGLLAELIGREDPEWMVNDEDSLLRAAENQRSREEYQIRHETAMAEHQEEMKSRALRDIKYASRHCPDCGYPVSDWLPTCRVCGFKIGRFNSRT